MQMLANDVSLNPGAQEFHTDPNQPELNGHRILERLDVHSGEAAQDDSGIPSQKRKALTPSNVANARSSPGSKSPVNGVSNTGSKE